MFGNRKTGIQVSGNEFRKIGSDCDRHGDLTKESGFYHISNGMVLKGKEWLGCDFLCPGCSKAHRSMWWLNGNHCLLPGTSRSLWGQVWVLGQCHSGYDVSHTNLAMTGLIDQLSALGRSNRIRAACTELATKLNVQLERTLGFNPSPT